ALKSYNKALSMLDKESDDKRYWSLYYSRGIAYERLGDWDKAEKDLKKALEMEPNHPYILNYLGYSWADQGKNLEEALEMIAQAVRLRPDDGYIVDSLGWVYFKLEDFERAVEPLETAVALMPEDATINDHLGDAYWKVGRKHEARFQWKRALSFAEEAPDNLSDLEAVELVERIKEKMKSGL
ncbi:MAG: tetratricopeptide repeat protein, partial [Bdellovibrionales bacterium]